MLNITSRDKGNLIWFGRPVLNHPYMIIGFEGWPDAEKVLLEFFPIDLEEARLAGPHLYKQSTIQCQPNPN